jgi:C4-dicarboxylate-specific signal transduction histidine kinase
MDADSDRLEQAAALLGELEAIEAKLRHLQDGLTRSHRLATLGTMASIIAHEFNNILTPMISYCELAQKHPHDRELVTKAIARSLTGAQKAAQICSSMLGFARAAEGDRACLIGAVVDEVFACLARDPAKDGIAVSLSIPPDAWVAISAVNLQQVLLNLVLNARQAMKRQRGGKLAITATVAADMTTIDVADSGPGIPADLLPYVFEPFVTRRDDKDPDAAKGTGLGLAICRDLVHHAHGSITIARTDSAGTTFRITLPTSSPLLSDPSHDSASAPRPAASASLVASHHPQ